MPPMLNVSMAMSFTLGGEVGGEVGGGVVGVALLFMILLNCCRGIHPSKPTIHRTALPPS